MEPYILSYLSIHLLLHGHARGMPWPAVASPIERQAIILTIHHASPKLEFSMIYITDDRMIDQYMSKIYP